MSLLVDGIISTAKVSRGIAENIVLEDADGVAWTVSITADGEITTTTPTTDVAETLTLLAADGGNYTLFPDKTTGAIITTEVA